MLLSNVVFVCIEICHTLSLHNVKMEYSMLVETFTAKDISQFFNYDILEMYGDAFLKFFSFPI